MLIFAFFFAENRGLVVTNLARLFVFWNLLKATVILFILL